MNSQTNKLTNSTKFLNNQQKNSTVISKLTTNQTNINNKNSVKENS